MFAIKSEITVILIVLIMSVSSRVFAEDEITFFLEDEPIYTSKSESSPGFLMEIVMEMSRVMDINPKVKFIPWKRAQYMAINTPNAVIFPLTRTESREHDYRWVFKIFDVPVMFVNKKGKPVINTVYQANQLSKIGVIRGTPQEEKLKEFDAKKIASIRANILYKVLAEDNVDAIFTARPEAVFAWKNGGYKEKLQFGKTLQILPLWLATSKKSTKIDDKRWNEALEDVKKSGFFDKTFEKYFGEGNNF